MKINYLASVFFLILIVATFNSCSNSNFTDYDVLGDLRVLAIIADQPEVNPGTTVNFTPVLSDLNGAGRTLNYSVQACIDPGVGIGVSSICNAPDPSSVQSGTVTIPAGASQTYTDAVASFSLTMPSASTIFASRSSVDQYNGVAYLVFYTVSVPNGGPSVTSFLRVIVSETTKVQKNQNPTITSVDLNDNAISGIFLMPTVSSNFSVISPASAAETYQTMDADGSFLSQTELLINTWFMSDGTFTYQRTTGNGEDSWTPPSAKPSGRGLVILVVTRDEHNGAVFQKIEMN